MSTNRKVTTMLPLTAPRTRDERGEGVLGVIVGAAVGLVILAGLLAFYGQSQNTSENTSATARQEAAMVEAFNRVGRDIQESARVVRSNSFEVVVERTLNTGTNVRTHYAVVGGDLITKRLTSPAAYSSTDTTWRSGATTIIEDVSTPSPFSYKDKNGAATWTPASVRLVEINMEALTETGKVPLKTAASIDEGDGGTTSTVRRTDPVATNDQYTLIADPSTVTFPTSRTFNPLANDTCNSATPCAAGGLNSFKVTGVTGAPAGVTATEAAGGMVRLDFASTPTASYSFSVEYVIADNHGSDEATIQVNVRLPFRIGNVGAWNHTNNAIEVIGGTGPFRAEIINPATGAVTALVCSACGDGISGASGFQIADANPGAGSALTYRVSEDSDGDGVYGDTGDSPPRTTSVVRQFPENLGTWAAGSERSGNKFAPTRGSNLITARTASVWPVVYGLKTWTATPARSGAWEDIYIDPALTTDRVVTTGTSCTNGWARCVTDSGKAAGSEAIYKAYGLADIPNGTVAGDTADLGTGLPACTPYPGSPVPLVASGSARLCPSADRTLNVDYKVSRTGAANGASAGTQQAVRAYQAPDVAVAPGSSLKVGDSIPGYVAGDSCTDVDDANGDNSKFSCDTRQTYVAFQSANFENNVCTRGNFWGTLPQDNPGGCQNLIRQGPTTGGADQENVVAYNAWYGNVGEWINAKTWGGTEGVWVYSCNYGGCSPSVGRPVRAYPQKSNFTEARQSVTPNQQENYWGWQSHQGIGEGEGTPDDCWTPPRPASCTTDRYPEARYSWSASAGASHYVLNSNMYAYGAYDRLSNYSNVNMGLNTSANVYIDAGWVNEIRISATSANGLRQDSTYMAGVPHAGSSMLSDSAVGRPDQDSKGWAWGLQWRPLSAFTSKAKSGAVLSHDWQWPSDYYVFAWSGQDTSAGWLYDNYGNNTFGGQTYGRFFGGLARYGLNHQGTPYASGASGNSHMIGVPGAAESYNTYQVTLGQDRPLHRLMFGGGSYTQPWLPFRQGWIASGAVRPWIHPDNWLFYGYKIPVNGTFNSGWGTARFIGTKWGSAGNAQTTPVNSDTVDDIFHGPWTPLEATENWNNNWVAVNKGLYVTRRVSKPEGWNRNPNPNWTDNCQFSCPY